ncbi:hypothetical protein TARUN_2517 [Trichoderma arundinaceum]|uniref:Uncharacterized protein n=1 Tax=Trichoderma arundinaceum TaxID=490622 RepID=A0A395NW50_TRIAR|nr:hypothetical protein TARUN_2517 [Trichoderma arundinaceum]
MRPFIFFGIAALPGIAAAWNGQVAAGKKFLTEGGDYQYIYLTDYTTGSTYEALLYGGFDGCTTSECSVGFAETSPGGYDFTAYVWRTPDGCHNIDFKGAFDAGHGYCCGSLPCNLSA